VAFKSKKHPSEEDRQELKIKKKQLKRDAKRCLWKTFGCLVVAIVCDIFQVLAIIALQHCHHEDLLGLYWPLWTLLGLGSTIAMVGVCINQAYGLLEQDLPPFGTALGTPVLVVCAIIHLIWNLSKDKLKKLKRKSDKNLETEYVTSFLPKLISMLIDNCRDLEKTITEVSARSTACNALSVLLEDGPVLQFWSSNKPHPPNAKVVGMLGDIVILDYKCPCRNGPHRFRTCSSRRSSVPSAAQAEASTQTAPDETL
jgi:hypothetical protein